MTQEEKASEIVLKIQAQGSLDYDARRANYMYDAAMEMAKWKDKQYAEAFAPILIELDQLKHQIKSSLP